LSEFFKVKMWTRNVAPISVWFKIVIILNFACCKWFLLSILCILMLRISKFGLFCLSFLFFYGSKFLFAGLLERVKHWGDVCFPFIILDACSDCNNKSNHTLQVYFVKRQNGCKNVQFYDMKLQMLTKSLNSPLKDKKSTAAK